MADLERDTRLVRDGAAYRVSLCPDWDVWGPNGGYLAAIALRAMGTESGALQPASLHCAYVRSPRSGSDVSVRVEPLRRSHRASVLQARIEQDSQPVLQATAWFVHPGHAGPTHDALCAPAVPPAESLTAVHDLLPPEQRGRLALWRCIEERPVEWIEDWASRAAQEPVHRTWCRVRSAPDGAGASLQAGAMAVLVDTFQAAAAMKAHAADALKGITPSLDLYVQFHRFTSLTGWYLCEARSPVSDQGRIGGTAHVWSADGSLVASGQQQMLYREVTHA